MLRLVLNFDSSFLENKSSLAFGGMTGGKTELGCGGAWSDRKEKWGAGNRFTENTGEQLEFCGSEKLGSQGEWEGQLSNQGMR